MTGRIPLSTWITRTMFALPTIRFALALTPANPRIFHELVHLTDDFSVPLHYQGDDGHTAGDPAEERARA